MIRLDNIVKQNGHQLVFIEASRGDERSYDDALARRAVTSPEGMTADYDPYDHAFLGRVANRIIDEMRGINRVTYHITSKPPGTIEWE